MSRFDHPAYGQKGEPMERPIETVTEVIEADNYHYYEVRLVVTLQNYGADKPRPSVLDLIMESLDDEIMVLEYSETPVLLITVKEVNQ